MIETNLKKILRLYDSGLFSRLHTKIKMSKLDN